MSANHQAEGEEWSRLLAECQEEVASSATNAHYIAAYRAEELSYWLHVPGWIYGDALERPSLRRCLDIGCAYGTLLLYVRKLTGCEAFGIDFTGAYMSPALLEKHGINFAVSNIELDPLPWPHGFDLIIFTEVLEHLNFRAAPTLRKLAGLLAPGGLIYLSTPDADAWGKTTRYYASYDELPEPREELRGQLFDDHVWQFDAAELSCVIGEAGLAVVRSDYAPGQLSRRHFNMTLRRSDE
jgi:SAM-dependent methyltransferase